jgi:CheY-like chemotaxis protein/HPt (histidine-containing phosphotransfer) domain-containing protein
MSLDLTVAVADPARLVRRGKAADAVATAQPAIDMDAPSTAQAADEGTLVLVVDDHPVNRMVMRKQLNTLGYAAEEAESGAEALEQWNTGRFALVLTDCNMPEMSGYELSQRIRETEAARGDARIPIVACSANVIHGVRQACREAGMDDYISKPTELVPMAEIMRRWLPLPGQRPAGAPASGDPRDAGRLADTDGPLDGRTLNAASKGDVVAAQRMIEHFRRVNDVDVAGLADAVECGDIAATTRLAHRIKGACGFIGATDLASVCAMLEQAGRAGDATAIDGLMTGFRSELERLNAYLDAQRPR